jgi:hypothetical protein
MFLRKNRKKSNGEVYQYWTLCETVRTELGPRQRVVATLGKLSEEDLAAGWEDIEGNRPRHPIYLGAGIGARVHAWKPGYSPIPTANASGHYA